VWRSAGADTSLRGRERHADALQGPLKLKHWALAIAKRSAMRKARSRWRLTIVMHAMLRRGTEFKPARST
jgi:hypothetical protein